MKVPVGRTVDTPVLPRISIVTPSYNQGAYLDETIRSILSQDYPDLEYIVMDGGSTDGSVEIIRRYADQISFWASEPDGGQADALRKGFCRATGDVFAWTNSDDTLKEGTLRKVGELFRRRPEIDLVYGNVDIVHASGERWYTAYPVIDLRILLYESPFIPQQAMFWRRTLYERVGGVNPALRFAMDFELTVKFLLGGARLEKIPEVLANFRSHPGAKSTNIRDVMDDEIANVIALLCPVRGGALQKLLRRMYYRALRFCREPGSFTSALKSRIR
jgi:glycosyltransferase involved in cell wall biosynthesis